MGYFQNQKRAAGKAPGLRSIGVLISERYLADYITFYWKIFCRRQNSAVTAFSYLPFQSTSVFSAQIHPLR